MNQTMELSPMRNYILLATLGLSLAASAQTINFENTDYKGLGVYDTWEASPFRTGTLEGNYAVVDNHLTAVEEMLGEVPNPSQKILAVQRSRFGSNTFGVRIDLNETFELTPQVQYLHVMVNRPYGGRIMVVGLGKRTDRPAQSPETEQFWAMSTTDVAADKWVDVVLPIKGNGGIDIHSLVVVPDCESPHNYTSDAICYIDNIEVNDNPAPKFVYGYYTLNFDKSQLYTRSDRRVNGIKLTTPTDGEQVVNTPDAPNTMYVDLGGKSVNARAGEQVTAALIYKGNWMHGYVFLDKNNDGKFHAVVNDDLTLPAESELMAFSFYGGDNNDNGKNSAGAQLSGQSRNTLNMPSFTLPADLEPGIYRLRYKVDWNSIDPAGSLDASNPIIGNGGGIVDVRLNIHGDNCLVNDANRNGEVLAADGSKLSGYTAPFGKPFGIIMNPEKGFEYSGIIVKHGYNLSGDSVDTYGNVQWVRTHFERQQFGEDHTFTIPAECMDGDVEIEGLFIEEGTYVEPQKPTRYTTTTVKDGRFGEMVPWYTIQIGEQGYVLADNGTAAHIALNNTSVDVENPAHLWCFTGNDEEGYRLYNMQAGATKVLAAPIAMQGTTGGGSYPVLKEQDNLPSGYTDLWLFADSKNLSATAGVEHAYMYEMGHPNNKVNNRDSKLAFWTGGADKGSTLQINFARLASSINCTLVEAADEAIYDLMGRRVLQPVNGLYIIGGKKMLLK